MNMSNKYRIKSIIKLPYIALKSKIENFEKRANVLVFVRVALHKEYLKFAI